MPHVILLGDSIFDNAAYVGGGPDVAAQLRRELPEGWRATLAAVDGATTQSMAAQYRRIPDDATHLVLSIGGNDALMHVDILERPASSAAEVLALLADVRDRFAERYREVVGTLGGTGIPLALCTIYEGSFPDARMQRLAAAALAVFNDVVLRTAFARRLDVLDLRLVCSEAEDYANPIEPSERGGEKIARAIARAVAEGEAGSRVVAG